MIAIISFFIGLLSASPLRSILKTSPLVTDIYTKGVIEIAFIDIILKSTVLVTGIIGLVSTLGKYSKEEQQFMNSVNRGFRGIVHWFLFTSVILVYFTVITGFNTNGTDGSLKIINFIFINPITPLITLALLLFILVSLSSKFRNFLKKKLIFSRFKTSIAYGIVFTVVFTAFSILVSSYFAIGVNFTLDEINKVYKLGVDHTVLVLFNLGRVDDLFYLFVLIFLIILYSFLLSLIRVFLLNVYLERVTVNIHLKNGEIIKDRFILNPNIDGGLMVGDTYGKSAENKALIPKSNIEMITFNRVGYSFGEKRRRGDIINPKELSEDELNVLVKKWRSKQKSKHSNF